MSFASFRKILGAVAANEELIFGSVWTAEAQSTEPEDAFEMSEEHLDLFSVRDMRRRRPRFLAIARALSRAAS